MRKIVFVFQIFRLGFCFDCGMFQIVTVEIEKHERVKKKEKRKFFNSTGIILRRNTLQICYSDCYSALHTQRATIANLKKKIEDAESVGGIFWGEQWLFSPKFGDAESTDDALIYIYICMYIYIKPKLLKFPQFSTSALFIKIKLLKINKTLNIIIISNPISISPQYLVLPKTNPIIFNF